MSLCSCPRVTETVLCVLAWRFSICVFVGFVFLLVFELTLLCLQGFVHS